MKEYLSKLCCFINDKCETLSKEFVLHAGVSALGYILLFNIIDIFMGAFGSAIIAAIITLAIGSFKEYYVDKTVYNENPSISDLNADIKGTILGFIITIPAILF